MLALRGREARPSTHRGLNIGHIAEYSDGTSRIVELFSWENKHWEILLRKRSKTGSLRHNNIVARERDNAVILYGEERAADVKRGARIILLSAI